MINPVANVQITPNKINFGKGVQTNYGYQAPSVKNNMVEGNLLTGFVGTVAPSLYQVQSRAYSIEKGLNQSKLNYIA